MSYGLGSSWFSSETTYAHATKTPNSAKSHAGHNGEVIDEKNLQKCLNCTRPECNNCVTREGIERHDAKRRVNAKYNLKRKESQIYMPSLYTINRQIEELLSGSIDLETGELLFTDEIAQALEQLDLDKEFKREAIAIDHKNCKAMSAALDAEIRALRKRKETFDRRAENDLRILEEDLNGEGFETAKVTVRFRKTAPSVELDNGFIEWAAQNNDSLLRYKDPEPDKVALKELLKSGIEIPFAKLVSKVSMIIK